MRLARSCHGQALLSAFDTDLHYIIAMAARAPLRRPRLNIKYGPRKGALSPVSFYFPGAVVVVVDGAEVSGGAGCVDRPVAEEGVDGVSAVVPVN